MNASPDSTFPVRYATRSRGFVLSAALLAAGFLALSCPIDAGGPHGGGGGSSRGGSGGGGSHSGGGRSSGGGSHSYSSGGSRSYSGGGSSNSGGGRSYSAGGRSSSSGGRSWVGGRSSSSGWRSWSSSTTSSAPTRSASGDRGYGSVGAQSSSGPRTFSPTGSRGGSGGPPPSGGNPGGGHPGGGNPGGPPPSGGGHPGGGGGHPGGGYPGGGHHGGGYYGGHHGWYCPPTYFAGSSWYWGGPWDWWWGWGSGWGWGWGPYGYGGGVYVINDGGGVAPDRYARVDTDVSPESAEVYLDGTYIGSADDFDGFPDYLYLEAGKYKLEFRHPYYETVVKELDVRPGQGISINDEMKLLPGKKRLEVVNPEERGTPLGRVFGKPEANAAAQGRDRTGRFEAEGAMDAGGAGEIKATDVDVLPPATPGAQAGAAPSPVEVAPADRGRLRFEVEPDDAAVYLDDRYVGTAEELSGLRRGLAVRPGKHTVTVVRPGYATRKIDVESRPGAAIDVVIELEK